MELRGEVSSGLGRAHIFMAQSHYQEQFKQVLGVTAWPGTLNIQLKGESLAHYIALRKVAGVGVKELPTKSKNGRHCSMSGIWSPTESTVLRGRGVPSEAPPPSSPGASTC